MIKSVFNKIIEKFSRVFHIIFIWWVPYALWRNSRRLKKWLKKNRKQQDPNLYSFSDRWQYIRKKAIRFNKRMGIKINVIGSDNIPKSGAWITPNHTSNFDGFYLIEALGSKAQLVPIAREDLMKKKIASGFLKATDSFVVDRNNLRQMLQNLNNSANYGRQNNRSIVIFPEGTRSLTTELLDFKCGGFKFAQKYALPVIPVTITGTLQAKRWWKLHYQYVNVIIHRPIKPIEHIKIPTDILCKRISEKIQADLTNYENKLSPEDKKYFEKLKKKAIKKDGKKNRKIEKQKKDFKNKEAQK